MKIFLILSILIFLNSCGETGMTTQKTIPRSFYIESNLYPSAGIVKDGIDFYGAFKNILGNDTHTTTFICDKSGNYKYEIMKNFMSGKFSVYDSTGVSNIFGGYLPSVVWESNVNAGTVRLFKAEQGPFVSDADCAFVVRVVRK